VRPCVALDDGTLASVWHDVAAPQSSFASILDRIEQLALPLPDVA